MKRILILALTILTTQMVFAEGTLINGLYFNLNSDGTAQVTFMTNNALNASYVSGSLTIPSEIQNEGQTYIVTSIGPIAFRYCSGLTSVTIPNSVTIIDFQAFDDCSGLTSVTIPNSVTTIGSSAFYNCSSLEKVFFSDLEAWCNIKFDGYSANPLHYAHHLYLNDEEIKDLVIPNSVTSIGNYAFRGCSGLTSVVIPNSVTSIDSHAFGGCTSLNDLRFEDGEDTLSLGYESVGSYTDGEGLFFNCPLKSLYLGRDLKYETSGKYGYSPFYGITTLTQVTIGSSVTSIGRYAFYNCSGLESVTIGKSVTSFDSSAFSGCKSIKQLIFEDGVDTLKLAYTTSDKTGFFSSCPLDVLYIGRNLSYGTYKSPFYGIKTLTQATIGNSVTSLGENLFGDTSLSSITIGESVNSIEANAFPSTLRIVTSLNPIPPTIKTNTFNSQTPKNGVLLVPESALTNYQYSPYWNEFMKIETIPDSGSGGSGDQNGENIFNVKIDKYIYMTIDEEQAFTTYLPSDVTASSWVSSNDDIVEVTKKGKAEAYEYGNVIVRALDSEGEPIITLGVFVCPTIKIHYGTDKSYEHHVIYNSTPSLFLAAPEGYEIASVMHDGTDVTEAVKANEGYYTPASPITDNTVISVSLNSTAIPGDLNGDGKVDTSDLNWLLEQMINF